MSGVDVYGQLQGEPLAGYHLAGRPQLLLLALVVQGHGVQLGLKLCRLL